MAFQHLPYGTSDAVLKLCDDTTDTLSFHQVIEWCLNQKWRCVCGQEPCLCREQILYRGHEKSDWPIRPSIARFRKTAGAFGSAGNPKDALNGARERMLEHLRFEAPFRDEELGLPAADREIDLGDRDIEPEVRERILLHWEMVGQHYGIPTRLLDWSESLFTALFFAYGGWSWIDLGSTDKPCVWCLNKEKVERGGVLLRSEDEKRSATLADYWRYPDAIRVIPRGRFVNPRQRIQTGWFTYMRDCFKPLEEYIEEKSQWFEAGTLIKIEMRADEQRDALTMLSAGGSRAAVIRGDIEGISKDAVNRHLRFMFEKIV
jgi:hypothetical protein